VRIAYLVNEYPKVSHSFIRREIQALEGLGLEISRYTVRAPKGPLPDPADREEAERTSVLLPSSTALLAPTLKTALVSPASFAGGLRAVASVTRLSDRSPAHHLAYFAEACALREHLQRDGSSHVHAHFGTNSATVAWLCSLIGGPPFSFTVHGPEEFDRAQGIALAAKMRAARFVVGISQYGRSQMLRLLPPDQWDKVKIVRCGLDSQLLNRTVTALPSTPRFICVARLSEQKGHMVLLEAARMLQQQGRHFELVLAGDGELRSSLEARIAEYGLGNQVRITGYISLDEVTRELESSRALVLPSFGEGLPVVIMEAFALGRPVISTYVAGIPELVRPGRNGWLVPAGSATELAHAMVEVIDASSEQLTTMGNHGKEDVKGAHDIAVSAEQLRQLFLS
jgi:colanic acid/amylovoran biosynthesis glycosyltransferase